MADLTIPKKIDSQLGLDSALTTLPLDVRKLFEAATRFSVNTTETETVQWGHMKLGPVEDVDGVKGLKERKVLGFDPDVRVRIRFRDDGDKATRVLIQTKIKVDPEFGIKGAKVDSRLDAPSAETLALFDRMLGGKSK